MEVIKTFFTQSVVSVCENIAVAALILIVGLWLVSLLDKAMKKGKLFKKIDPAARDYIHKSLVIALKALVIISAAGYLGVPMASVAAVLGSAGLALGLALQGGLSNIAGGIMIIVTKPFKIGDYIVIGDRDGTVESIGIYYTTLITPDNKRVTMPNGSVTSSTITNFSAKSTRRLDLDFSVSYDSDTDKVKTILKNVAEVNELVLKDPAPQVMMSQHSDSAVVFKLRVWMKSESYWDVNFGLIEAVKRAFDEEKIEIPYPQMDVHVKGGTAVISK